MPLVVSRFFLSYRDSSAPGGVRSSRMRLSGLRVKSPGTEEPRYTDGSHNHVFLTASARRVESCYDIFSFIYWSADRGYCRLASHSPALGRGWPRRDLRSPSPDRRKQLLGPPAGLFSLFEPLDLSSIRLEVRPYLDGASFVLVGIFRRSHPAGAPDCEVPFPSAASSLA
jgi:hypothetical protein